MWKITYSVSKCEGHVTIFNIKRNYNHVFKTAMGLETY